MTLQPAQLATRPPSTALIKSGTVITIDRVVTMLAATHAMAPEDAESNVTTVVLAETRSAFDVVDSVDAGLKAKKPTNSKKVPKRSCTGLLQALIGEYTAFSTSSLGIL